MAPAPMCRGVLCSRVKVGEEPHVSFEATGLRGSPDLSNMYKRGIVMKKNAVINLVHRTLPCALVAMMAITCALVLPGCTDDKAAVQQATDAAFSEVKNADDATIESALSDSGMSSELESYGVSATDFYHAFIKHFSYTINDVTVDGSTATVSVTSTNADFTSIVGSWESDVIAYCATPEGIQLYQDGGENGLMQKAFQMLMDDLNADDAPTTSSETTLHFTKGSDGTWQPSDQSEVESVVLGGSDLSSLESAS